MKFEHAFAIRVLVRVAAKGTGVTPKQVCSAAKPYPVALARMAVCYVARTRLGLSCREIAPHVNRKASSVDYAVREIRGRLTVDPMCRLVVDRLVQEVVS